MLPHSRRAETTADSGLFPAMLRYRAETTPERLALIAGDERITYAGLDGRVDAIARKLAGVGVRTGQPVATLMRNSARVPEVVHALSRVGAVLVPLNLRLTPSELAWQLADSGVQLLLVDDQTAAQAREAIDELGSADPAIRIVSVESGDDAALPLVYLPETDFTPNESVTPDDLFAIVYTSGTTGRPKGAMITQGNIWWSAIGSALNLGSHIDDRWLACMPLFHVGGLSILTRSAIYGITAVIQERFDPAAVNRAIEDEHVTTVSVVSAMLRRMLDARESGPYPDWLRCVLLGGGPAPRPLLEDCARIGVPVVQTYGLTETCSQAATLGPEDALRKLGSAGKALFPNQLRIGRDDGSIALAGEAGEILIQGPVVTRGYAGRAEATARTLAGGWLHTGDVGYLDDDGYLYVLDRRSDLIVSGGENVYPAEVEAALLSHPLVAEAGVIGLPDDEWGQVVVAVVRTGDSTRLGPDLEARLREFCRGQLAGYKVPRRIHFIDAPLPRTAGGKLLRRALRTISLD